MVQVDLLSSPILWIGIGCQKGISCKLISTVDMKASELGLIEFCNLHNFPLKTFSKATLASVSVPNPSEKITATIGISSVAEAAAIFAASQTSTDVILLVPKQIFRLSDEFGVVTIAVAGVNNM